MEETSFIPIMEKVDYTILGVMSGTSLDGVDLAVVQFSVDNETKFDIIAASTIPYSFDWKEKLQKAAYLSAYDFLKLHKEYGRYIGMSVNHFLKTNLCSVDFIASHGHTIFHEPQHRFNFQLGDGAFIAATTGITTISDFRTLDIAFGGQGAPLVPIGDELLFGEYDYCLNIGGIANISFRQGERRVAYDICPANMVLNEMAQKAGVDYDDKGNMASKGMVQNELLQQLNQLDYYAKPFPKSLGREWVEQYFWPLVYAKNYSVEDFLATLCEHMAIQIGNSIFGSGKLLITGGGACNDFLIRRIEAHAQAKIVIPDALIVHYKEALIFSFLGYLRIRHQANSLASVTGSPVDVCSGVVHWVS